MYRNSYDTVGDKKLGKGGKPSTTGKPSGKGRDNSPPKK